MDPFTAPGDTGILLKEKKRKNSFVFVAPKNDDSTSWGS